MAKVNGLKACLVLPSWAKLLKFTNFFAGAANRTMKFWDLETFEMIGYDRCEVSKLCESFLFFLKGNNYIDLCHNLWLHMYQFSLFHKISRHVLYYY